MMDEAVTDITLQSFPPIITVLFEESNPLPVICSLVPPRWLPVEGDNDKALLTVTWVAPVAWSALPTPITLTCTTCEPIGGLPAEHVICVELTVWTVQDPAGPSEIVMSEADAPNIVPVMVRTVFGAVIVAGIMAVTVGVLALF
jgi:hypothetical protein